MNRWGYATRGKAAAATAESDGEENDSMHAADVPDQSDGDTLALYAFVKAYLHVFSKDDASGRVMATRVCACEVRTATCASLAGWTGHLLFRPAAQ